MAGAAGQQSPAGSAAADLRFRVLGDLAGTRDAQPLDLGPAKQRAVLAVLLVNLGRPVPVDRIVAEVWGDDPPAHGANVVQKYVAGLRRALDPAAPARSAEHVLGLREAGYSLRLPPTASDAEVFARAVGAGLAARRDGRPEDALRLLRGALAGWGGQPYPGIGVPAVQAERARLEGLQGDALEACVELELELADPGAAPVEGLLAEAADLVRRFPARERLRRVQVLALHRAGRTAEALEAYRAAREHLVREHGIEPGPALREAHRQVLQADAAPPAVVLPAAAAPPAAPASAGSASAVPQTAGADRPVSRRGVLGRALVVGLPLLTLGLGTWVVLLVLARARRSRWLAGWGLGYLVATVLLLVLLPVGSTGRQADRIGAVIIAFMLLGTVQVAAHLFSRPS